MYPFSLKRIHFSSFMPNFNSLYRVSYNCLCYLHISDRKPYKTTFICQKGFAYLLVDLPQNRTKSLGSMTPYPQALEVIAMPDQFNQLTAWNSWCIT